MACFIENHEFWAHISLWYYRYDVQDNLSRQTICVNKITNVSLWGPAETNSGVSGCGRMNNLLIESTLWIIFLPLIWKNLHEPSLPERIHPFWIQNNSGTNLPIPILLEHNKSWGVYGLIETKSSKIYNGPSYIVLKLIFNEKSEFGSMRVNSS